MVVLGGERLLDHHDLVVIDEEQIGKPGHGDTMEEDVDYYLPDGVVEGVRSKWASKRWADLIFILY